MPSYCWYACWIAVNGIVIQTAYDPFCANEVNLLLYIVLGRSCACTISFHLQFLVEKLFWPVTPLLESVGIHEPQVNVVRMELCQAINRALIPLRAYAIKFEPHLELMNMDIKLFIQ